MFETFALAAVNQKAPTHHHEIWNWEIMRGWISCWYFVNNLMKGGTVLTGFYPGKTWKKIVFKLSYYFLIHCVSNQLLVVFVCFILFFYLILCLASPLFVSSISLCPESFCSCYSVQMSHPSQLPLLNSIPTGLVFHIFVAVLFLILYLQVMFSIYL